MPVPHRGCHALTGFTTLNKDALAPLIDQYGLAMDMDRPELLPGLLQERGPS